jgi:DNA-binding MarR family transcriptional regulator
MKSKLQSDLRKTKPFESLEQEAMLNLVRTHEILGQGFAELFKPLGISPTQYNVLRILRGAGACCGETGIACRAVGQRMLTRDPDITRLLDRMEKAALIVRARSENDRRVVKAAVTAKGLKILRDLDRPVMDLHRRQLGHLGEAKLKKLVELLEEAREPGPPV